MIAVPLPGRLGPLGWRIVSRRRARVVILSLAASALLLGGGWLWFRDSSLVAVQQVRVSGDGGPEAGAIRTALLSAARSMTTLDVQVGQLHAAVSAFPEVKSLQVSTQFPHGMRIRVVERLPVAVVVVSGRQIAVAADGTLLQDLNRVPVLPRIELSVPPGGPRLSDARALQALAAATAAPQPLLRRIRLITTISGRGLVAALRDGPAIYLGDATQLRAKWAAAVAVLGDSGSVGASYIDVSDPARPAAGAQPLAATGGHNSTAGGP